MLEIFIELEKRGCNVEKTRERFLNDDDFYLDCYRDVINDQAFEALGDSLKAHNITQSFELAHMLKGIVANMGLTSLFDKIVGIVEPLRNEEDIDYSKLYNEMMEERDYYRSLI